MATKGDVPRRSIQFAGQQWWVKWSTGPVGPGGNCFDDSEATVAVDDAGSLVLRIRRSNGRWVCAEVIGEEVTAYGRYEWTVRTVLTDLDRNVVCGMFTWSDDDDFPHNREIDVEVSAWGGTGDVGGMFVVQPACLPGHVRPFAVPNGEPWRCWFEWTPEAVVFGATDTEPWTFAGGGVPEHGGVHPRINLWLYEGVAPQTSSDVVVTLGDFRFTGSC